MSTSPQPASQQPATTESLPFPLQNNEQVIQLYRRHWWFLWPRTIWLALLAVAPVTVVFLILSAAGIYDDLTPFSWIIAALWIAYWGVRALFNWYRYHNDIWVVTDQRIVDSFKPHPFSKRVATADLVNLQDLSIQKTGLTATMLNYGDVICETASAGAAGFIIGGVPNPETVQALIDGERDRARGRQ
jgi:hypothetical protein